MRDLPKRHCSQSSLFSALSDDALAKRANRGDDFALNTLLNRYRDFVRIKARSYFLVGADKEDIIQEGMIGLFKAIRDYDARKNPNFKPFAQLCITRQIITAVKTATRYKHSPLNNYVSLNCPVYIEENGSKDLIDILDEQIHPDPGEQVSQVDEVSGIKDTCECLLSGFEKKVLQEYLEGLSYDEIADSLDRQVKAIDNALQRIRRKVEAHMHRNGDGE